MNLTRISLPPESCLILYYWYSYFTLFLSWLLFPSLFYVILTQSKNMKTFKWLILNHSFWSLAFETGFALVKPLIIAPAPAGFPLGLLKNGNFKSTALTTLFIISFVANSNIALITTLFSRYMLVFPSKWTEFFTLKRFIWFTAGLVIIIYICISIILMPLLNTNENIIREEAIKYDPFLENFINEPGFIFIPYKFAEFSLLLLLILLTILVIGAIGTIIFFIYLVKSQSTITTTRLQKSLIVSCIIQIGIQCIFLISPLMAMLSFVYFQISYSATALCFFGLLTLSHSYLEFIATLFWVYSYRKFIFKFLKKCLIKIGFKFTETVATKLTISRTVAISLNA